MTAQLIAIDWGTTNFRAYLLASQATILNSLKAPKGISHIAVKEFPLVYKTLLDKWFNQYPNVPVIMSGMVGSSHGWQEVAYLNCPAPFDALALHLEAVQDDIVPKPYIVPGVSIATEKWCDVMRGEETEVYGAYDGGDYILCIPGTHSKWVHVKDNQIIRFTTYMSGELYTLLAQYSILSKQIIDQRTVDAAFECGLAQAKNQAGLLANIFNIRAKVLHHKLNTADIENYLSGLIIGSELFAARSYWEDDKSVVIIAGAALAKRYQRAMQQFDINTRIMTSDIAVTRGLWKIALLAKIIQD